MPFACFTAAMGDDELLEVLRDYGDRCGMLEVVPVDEGDVLHILEHCDVDADGAVSRSELLHARAVRRGPAALSSSSGGAGQHPKAP